MTSIILPASGWQPRHYQRKVWRYLEGGGKRAVLGWHRRSGKDDVALHWAATAAHERVAPYWHMLPEAAQARKAIWDAVNPHTGRKRIDEAFPQELRKTTRNNEMFIEFKNGSTWQVVGSDNYNSLVGTAPAGLVGSEWALADPNAWAYLRPILAENGGWALFISTPRGANHFKTMMDNAKASPDWFSQILPATETGVFSDEQLAAEEAEYIADYGLDDGRKRFRQEYLCDFEAAVPGAYYGGEMARARDENRIRSVPWLPKYPVHTAWDIGIGDSTAIWCFQYIAEEIRLIDYVQNSGVALGWYVNELGKKPYTWGIDLLPHDAEPDRLQTGESIQATLRGLGRQKTSIVGMAPIYVGINAVRDILPRCYFDAEKTQRGVNALSQYRRQWDEKRKVFHDKPLHDWASDPADAFRYLALGLPLVDVDAGWGKAIAYPKQGIV